MITSQTSDPAAGYAERPAWGDVPADKSPEQHALPEHPAGTDARVALLAEVDFKWLMAGEGWWIDTTRLHCDASYAARLLRCALTSKSSAVRQCAASLQLQYDRGASCDRCNPPAALQIA